MEKLTERMIERICELALEAANRKAEDAAMGGNIHDGGASALRSCVEIWKAGLTGTVPKALKMYYEDAIHERDPEWKEYLRLKSKFE